MSSRSVALKRSSLPVGLELCRRFNVFNLFCVRNRTCPTLQVTPLCQLDPLSTRVQLQASGSHNAGEAGHVIMWRTEQRESGSKICRFSVTFSCQNHSHSRRKEKKEKVWRCATGGGACGTAKVNSTLVRTLSRLLSFFLSAATAASRLPAAERKRKERATRLRPQTEVPRHAPVDLLLHL